MRQPPIISVSSSLTDPRYLFDTLHVVFAVRIHKIQNSGTHLQIYVISHFFILLSHISFSFMCWYFFTHGDDIEVVEESPSPRCRRLAWSLPVFGGGLGILRGHLLVALSHCSSLGTNPRPLIRTQPWNNPLRILLFTICLVAALSISSEVFA